MHARLLFATLSLGLSAPHFGHAQFVARRHELALIGAWQLDPGRTHYGAGVDRRRREHMRCDVREERLDCTVKSVRADGRRLTAHFSAPLTGATAAVTGLADIDTIRLQAGPHGIVDATFSYRGRPAFGYRAYRGDDNATLVVVAVDPRTRAALTSAVVYSRVGMPTRTMSPNER